jgi:hypothetical protein
MGAVLYDAQPPYDRLDYPAQWNILSTIPRNLFVRVLNS